MDHEFSMPIFCNCLFFPYYEKAKWYDLSAPKKKIWTLKMSPPFNLKTSIAKTLTQDQLEPFLQILTLLLHKYPRLKRDLFAELERFLNLSTEEFRKRRSTQSLLRLISSYHFLRKKMFREIRTSPEKRHLFVRLLSSQLSFPFGKKNVLGLAIVAHLPRRYEFFDEHHIHLALQELSPSIQFVPGSFYFSQTSHDKLRLFYVEIEKEDGSGFTLKEYKILKTQIAQGLKKRIERLSPSIFMMRNIEETMKNTLVLSQELNSSSDIPQLMISLEKQTSQNLFFTVTLVRILKKTDRPLRQLFEKLGADIKFSPENEQIVGYLSDRSPKEAHTFQLQLSRSAFLRYDSSTNFYAARKKIVSILNEALGEIRDYNGGIFLKQGEALSQLKEIFPTSASELIEELFYSITPIEMPVILPLQTLQNFFKSALKISEEEPSGSENYICQMQQEKDWVFFVLHANDFSLRAILEEALGQDSSISSFSITFQEKLLAGYLCFSSIQEQQNNFFLSIQQGLENWKKKKQDLSLIRLYYQDRSYSLDPRLGGDIHSTVVLKALFDGLTRRGKDGHLALAAADQMTISEDLKCYTFHLRKSFWSNRDLVTAYDFEYAWKKILSPHFNSSFAYLFYPIKNAQAIKKGILPINLLGVHVFDDKTLSIELEEPCPYFLELLSHVLYSPVNRRVDQKYPNWFTFDGSSYICNGPFYLLKLDLQWGRYELAKNPLYWDAKEVQLDKILLLKADAKMAFEMFKNDEIDWLGRPASPWDVSFSPYNQIVQSSSTYTVYWYVFNVQSYPFHNKNLRRAIAHVIDRKQLLALHPHIGSPAMTPLPLSHTQHGHLQVTGSSTEQALDYFEKALKELGLNREQFPGITLACPNGEIRYQMALLVKQQIEQTLNIRCQIQIYPWEELFTKMTQGDYQFGSMGWTALINDPFYTLNAFKHAHEGINFAKWENAQYKTLLDSIAKETNPIKRQKYIAQSEALLIEEAPLIPIYYELQQYVKKSHIQLPHNQEVKDIDFKWISTAKNG
ncbi:MAG: peptide ABC transporter substrate-binding protein [Rhabdochlamydiaceae bacterium]